MSRFPRWALWVLTVASVTTVVLLVTGWGPAIAANVSSVFVTNTASNPVPVHEQGTANVNVTNTDANGNIKVHEQGTANVNVTNSSLTVAAQAPVTGGGGDAGFLSAGPGFDELPTATATALAINMGSGVDEIVLEDSSSGHNVAAFLGPNRGGNSEIVISLTRPITFDRIFCLGASTGCTVSWIGNSP